MATPGRWWIAGGWAIDAFTGTARAHGDLDIGIPRIEAAAFIEFVGATLDVWAAAGSLTPLPRDVSSVPDDCGNLGCAPAVPTRENTTSCSKTFATTTGSTSEPHTSHGRSVTVMWLHDGVTYLRPEIQLLLKAKHDRPKDALDLERCLSHLDDHSRTWLTPSLRQENPQHPWLGRLTDT